jgi:tight adherence protein B
VSTAGPAPAAASGVSWVADGLTGAASAVSGRVAFGAALALVFVAVAITAWLLLDAATRAQRPAERMDRRLAAYTITGRPVRRPTASASSPTTLLGDSVIGRGAVELAGRVTRSRGLDTAIDSRLEAAGLPLRTAEWLLVHVGTAVGSAVLLLVVSGGGLAATVLGLFIGLTAPWIVLVLRQGRRETAFLTQLPDTLQLIAGSLQAGYSLPQALDTVVREGQPPMSSEFNRALIENRLGRNVEDALDGIANRMSSQDFSWVVMAIRIQREVGGNLAELLTTVGDTIRERQRLRRQVKVLSAEGRLSAWILGSLPVIFTLYLVLVKPGYLAPMLREGVGLLMIGMAVVLMVVGAVWISRVVRVEV